MSTESVHNAIRSRFYSEVESAASLDNKVQYDNQKKPSAAGGDSLWVRFKVLPGDSAQVDTGSSSHRYRSVGIAVAQIFAPVNTGTKSIATLTDTIKSAFRGVTASGVKYVDEPQEQNVGRSGKYWQHNVTIKWQADNTA